MPLTSSALSSASMYWAITPRDLHRNKFWFRKEIHVGDIPDRCYPNLDALGINQESTEYFKKIGQMWLESFHDALKDSEEDVWTNFAVRDLWRNACLLQKRKELRPCALGNFDGGNGSNNACSGMANEITATDGEIRDRCELMKYRNIL